MDMERLGSCGLDAKKRRTTCESVAGRDTQRRGGGATPGGQEFWAPARVPRLALLTEAASIRRGRVSEDNEDSDRYPEREEPQRLQSILLVARETDPAP